MSWHDDEMLFEGKEYTFEQLLELRKVRALEAIARFTSAFLDPDNALELPTIYLALGGWEAKESIDVDIGMGRYNYPLRVQTQQKGDVSREVKTTQK